MERMEEMSEIEKVREFFRSEAGRDAREKLYVVLPSLRREEDES